VLSGSLRPHAHAQLAKGDTEGETATKSYARHAFEVTHKAVGRAAPLVALLAVLRSYILPSKHFLSSLFLKKLERSGSIRSITQCRTYSKFCSFLLGKLKVPDPLSLKLKVNSPPPQRRKIQFC
jgi:hypothetical protein